LINYFTVTPIFNLRLTDVDVAVNLLNYVVEIIWRFINNNVVNLSKVMFGSMESDRMKLNRVG